jgi:hypothetical protein
VIPAYFLTLDREQPAKAAIRRRVAHMRPSSLCGRLAGRCPGEMGGEECARLFCRVLGRRLVLFGPVAEIADTGGPIERHRNYDGLREKQSERLARHLAGRVRPFHGTAPPGSLHPPRRSGSGSAPSRCRCRRDVTAGVISDRGAKPIAEAGDSIWLRDAVRTALRLW